MAAATFLSTLESESHSFLQPDLPLYTDAVAYLKNILDPLAKDISAEQQQRLKESRKKRKRGEGGDEEVLRLRQIHTDGFGIEQVWEQARRVLDAAIDEVQHEYEKVQAQLEDDSDEGGDDGGLGSDEENEDLGMEGVDYEVDGIDDGEEEYHSDEDEEEDEELDLDGDLHDDFDDMDLEEDENEGEEPATEFVEDRFGLNDGFFSIDDFNKQSVFLEQQDVRGEAEVGDDDEEIDFDADPMAQASGGAKVDAEADDEESEDEEDGPTFGDPDAESEEEDEDGEGVGDMDGMGGTGNTNSIMYADFFAPPAQKKRKNKKGRPNPHNFPEASTSKSTNGAAQKEWAEPEDMQRTMDAVHRDLFEESDEDEEEEDEKPDPADPRSRRSAHERRKLQLQEEIRKLEAANVAKRDWQLSGEARAADRPVNALLEEDLDFERAGKPVPVITAEISEDIESLIKRRILAFAFQDIIKRRPDDLATGNGKRGKLDFELEDTKSKKGLAEEYEEEYSRRTDPNYVDVKDEKLAKEQKEIEALWKEVCGQLDSLSSWNFRPKAPAPQMDIRVDAPAITMEDARPSAGGEVAGASLLAPQEIYTAGEGSKTDKSEVVGKSGLPTGREELDQGERKRRRRREKERTRKASGNAEGTNGKPKESKAKKDKKDMLGDLKKGGVRVIGKKGQVTDVQGNEARNQTSGQGAGRYKL
ncbi:U3 small nucleolar ribonucleoprotein MPP10 [Cercospora zeina]